MRALGAWLVEVAGAPLRALVTTLYRRRRARTAEELARRMPRLSRSAHVSVAKTLLEAVRRSIDLDPLAVVDLLPPGARAEAGEGERSLRDLLVGYGRLLAVWPDLWASSTLPHASG